MVSPRADGDRLDNGTNIECHFALVRRSSYCRHHIEPGRPSQNESIESFDGRLRDKLFNQTLFRFRMPASCVNITPAQDCGAVGGSSFLRPSSLSVIFRPNRRMG
jgi:hypothetical protein